MVADTETRRITELRKKMHEEIDQLDEREKSDRIQTTRTETQRCVKTLYELIKVLEDKTVINSPEAKKLRDLLSIGV